MRVNLLKILLVISVLLGFSAKADELNNASSVNKQCYVASNEQSLIEVTKKLILDRFGNDILVKQNSFYLVNEGSNAYVVRGRTGNFFSRLFRYGGGGVVAAYKKDESSKCFYLEDMHLEK